MLLGKPNTFFVLFVTFVAVFSATAHAQSADPDPTVTGTFSNVTRVENWSFFHPSPGATSNPDYTFLGDRAELGASVTGARFDLAASFNYVRMENLPTNAIGPGGLGAGAFYYYSSGVRYSYQLYLSEAVLRAKARDGRWSVAVGRMRYASGAETTTWSADLDALMRDRLQSRLVGTFDYALYQRRFDGVRADVNRPTWHFTAAAFLPTQGGFEESTNLSMPKLQVGSAVFTERGGPSASPRAWQAFAYLYRDRRPITCTAGQHRDIRRRSRGRDHCRVRRLACVPDANARR